MRRTLRWTQGLVGLLLWGGCEIGNPCYKVHPTADCTQLDLSGLLADAALDMALACRPVTDQVKAGEVLVPCGQFLMGSKPMDASARANEQPATVQSVQAFYLDVTEVTESAYLACVTAGGCTPPVGMDTYCNYQKGGKENHPINCVNWEQARVYCAWAGQRLPTEIEWEYTARGVAHSTYPWGDAAPVARGMDMGLSQTCWNQSSAGTCEVGLYPKTLFGQWKDDGVADMAGNVWEWTDSQFCSYPLPNQMCSSGDMGSNTARVIRGDSWIGGNPPDLRAANRTYRNADYWDRAVGFRCARTPL